MEKRNIKEHYTVVGMNPPGGGSSLRDDSFVEWVKAHSPQAAVKAALAERMGKTHFTEDELTVLAVFQGKHADCFEDEQEAMKS